MSNEQPEQQLKEIEEYYDAVYYKKIRSTYQVSSHYDRLAKRIGIQPKKKILDVACGTGIFLIACHRRGGEVAGVDLSTKAIEACKTRLPKGDFHQGPAETLPFPDNTFDVVSCLGAIEHFVDPNQALNEMRRVAKPDATFLLLVPNADFLTRKIGLFEGTDQVDAKEEVLTIEEWETLFAKSELTVSEKWKDLHICSWTWLKARRWYRRPHLALQGLILAITPLRWQYQIYFLCKNK